MRKRDGTIAVIAGGSTGMAPAGAGLFVEEGAAEQWAAPRRSRPSPCSSPPIYVNGLELVADGGTTAL